jgi:cytoskeletal protein CcmA (bactofilin family)
MGIFGKNDSSRPPEPPPTRPVTPTLHAAAPAAHAAPAVAAPAAHRSGPCVIGSKVQLKGELQGAEAVLVEGMVEGSIRLTAELRIAPGGTVKADVSANTVVVAGEVIGDCHATERVVLESTGRLTGNIRAPRIVIAEGASFRGTSDMSARAGDKA